MLLLQYQLQIQDVRNGACDMPCCDDLKTETYYQNTSEKPYADGLEFKITPKPPSKIGKGVLYCTPYRTLADLHPACGIELALKNAD